MKIKLLASRVGTGFAQAAGEVIEVDDDEGQRMIATNGAVEFATELAPPSRGPDKIEPPAEVKPASTNSNQPAMPPKHKPERR